MTVYLRGAPRTSNLHITSTPVLHDAPMDEPLNRRRLLQVGVLAVAGIALDRRGVLGAAGQSSTTTPSSHARVAGSSLILANDPMVAARGGQRRRAGSRVVKATVTAGPVKTIVGGKEVSTWAFGERPGTGALRMRAGDLVEATFVNRLAGANTLHWHGLALRNDMDGVHGLTQEPVQPGGSFVYRFIAPDPGTYWFHPHMGLELDRGLYAPFIVEDPNEPVDADVDVTLMLDDWLDGHGPTQEQVLAKLRSGGGHSGHDMASMEAGDMDMAAMTALVGDVDYPLHLINGRAAVERETIKVRPGQLVRLRLINAGSDTAYRVAVGGHRLTVTHADGFAVKPVEVDNVVLGMGERYDVIVTAKSGAFPIVAVAEEKQAPAGEAVLRSTTAAPSPKTGSRPRELQGRTLAYRDLVPTDAVRLPTRTPTRTSTITLTADPEGYVHGINGRSYSDATPIVIRSGERLRLRIRNTTMMFHPMHLHGHTFQVVGSSRKDTVNVLPMQTVQVDIEADNPGQWMLHCHNTYHFETGMATVLSYRR